MQLFRRSGLKRPEESYSSWTPAEDVLPQLRTHAQPELRQVSAMAELKVTPDTVGVAEPANQRATLHTSDCVASEIPAVRVKIVKFVECCGQFRTW